MRARVLTRFVAATVVAGGVLVVSDTAAFAGSARGRQDDSGLEAGASTSGRGPNVEPVSTGSRRHGGAAPTCSGPSGTSGPMSWRRVPEEFLGEAEMDTIAQEGGSYVTRFCGDGLATAGPGVSRRYRPPAGAAEPVVDPGELAEEALASRPLPEPQITMAPAPDIPQLVNLATYLWLPADQWKPETVSASAGGVTSTVTATPTRVIWDMGQGDRVVCDGPGLPYDPSLSDEAQPSDCHYTYRRSSAGQPGQAYQVTATVEWETTWSVTGAAGGGSLGTATSSSTTSVQVAELQSLNVVPDQGA